ncbi:transcriptional regulator [Salmonella enterica subsp. diarizonae]|uniref:Transcriptional regulator n=1 Tax=Salmonella diarizonae TaxID=59204 RepID=A0A379TXY0_SALDZ|nr:transcriptional regulator [Salmonella enterica]ECH9340010.1 transcriptional regulator [Salmonella enterica subsp. diarizonae]EDU9900448.1 transcriptional regulator [Salmonella enterica subsp. diarizonae]KAA8692219.1 transcriptional regulator [Salmonella enterica subsp. diarizonae]SUG54349.1 transcriptional regulator [Salmonella enterica subsp. diarizonae]VFS68559.1 transcriptional regulator [Salmonella enterica subsp. diarizonae]
MTGSNRMPARQVIIHGDCWPVVSAVAHLSRAVLPWSECETTYTLPELLQQLHRKPEAMLVLCLRPREHIFLFYALKEVLLYHPALVISDELLFSDRVVLHNWGELPAVLHQELTVIVTRIRQNEKLSSRVKSRLTSFLADPKPATGLFAVPLIFNHPKRLMNYMALLMFRATVNCGITPEQQKLLEEVYKGKYSLSEMTAVLNRNEKQIWQDKYRLLVKLGMKNRLYELLYGTRFCPEKQRTAFIPPDEINNMYGFEDSGRQKE